MADKKCRFRLNLFDGIVILLALAVGGVMLWMQMKPAASADSGEPAAASMHYTIRLQKTVPGTGELVETGDALVDVVKNMALGSVVSATVMPATDSIIDEDAEAYVTAEIPGYEDVEIVVESTATYGEERVVLGSGYEVRVGEKIYVRGPGYLGSGEVYAIERGN